MHAETRPAARYCTPCQGTGSYPVRSYTATDCPHCDGTGDSKAVREIVAAGGAAPPRT